MFNFINNIGPTELIIIVIILFLLFGGVFIKRVAKTSGETVKELKNIKKEFTSAIEDDDGKGVAK